MRILYPSIPRSFSNHQHLENDPFGRTGHRCDRRLGARLTRPFSRRNNPGDPLRDHRSVGLRQTDCSDAPSGSLVGHRLQHRRRSRRIHPHVQRRGRSNSAERSDSKSNSTGVRRFWGGPNRTCDLLGARRPDRPIPGVFKRSFRERAVDLGSPLRKPFDHRGFEAVCVRGPVRASHGRNFTLHRKAVRYRDRSESPGTRRHEPRAIAATGSARTGNLQPQHLGRFSCRVGRREYRCPWPFGPSRGLLPRHRENVQTQLLRRKPDAWSESARCAPTRTEHLSHQSSRQRRR